MVREPVVAGQFYPADKDSLLKMLDSFFEKTEKIADLKAAVVPHAGYIYSGKVAACLYSRCPSTIETAVILGPNHTGLGDRYSIMKKGLWRTPLGEISIDEDLAGLISKNAEILQESAEAHLSEHSIEVQLPFLQYINPKIKFVPIVLASHKAGDLRLIADSLALAAQEKHKKILVIASSDFTHYEEAKSAEEKDKKAIEDIIALDDDQLLQDVRHFSISMCGSAPCYTAVNFAKKVGAKKGRLIKYQTSAEVSGDYSSVVGYAAVSLA